MLVIDYLNVLEPRPRSEEDRAFTKQLFDKLSAWAAAHPDCVPRIPHFEHTCLDRANCRRQHDAYPPIL